MTVGTGLDALERGKRARTLGAVVQNVATVLVVGIARADGPQASSSSTSRRC